MSGVILLDAGPIGLITNPKLSPESTACTHVTLTASDVIIATTNVGHLSRFVQTDLWQNITPG